MSDGNSHWDLVKARRTTEELELLLTNSLERARIVRECEDTRTPDDKPCEPKKYADTLDQVISK